MYITISPSLCASLTLSLSLSFSQIQCFLVACVHTGEHVCFHASHGRSTGVGCASEHLHTSVALHKSVSSYVCVMRLVKHMLVGGA